MPSNMTSCTALYSTRLEQAPWLAPVQVVGQIAQIFIGSALAKYFARQVKREQMLAAAAAPDPSSEAPGATDAGGDGMTVKDSCKTLPSLPESSGDASPTAAAAAAAAAGSDVEKAKDLEMGAPAEPAAAGTRDKQ